MYSYNVFHNSNITASNPETLPYTGGRISEGNLLSSTLIQQTIVQVTVSSIEIYDEKKYILSLVGIHKNAVQISDQNTVCIDFSKLTCSPLSALSTFNIKSKITKPNVNGTQRGTVDAMLSYSI